MGSLMPSFQEIKNRKISIAVVGCGRSSKNHFGSIEKHAIELDLVAVCDYDKAILDAHAKR